MYNLFTLVRVTGASAEELIGALSHVIGNHPAILTELQENENGEVLQHYVVDDMPEMVVENISKKDFEEIKKALVRPYNLMNSPLFRCRVFSVEQETYFFFDVHHIIFDGFSVQPQTIITIFFPKEKRRKHQAYIRLRKSILPAVIRVMTL